MAKNVHQRIADAMGVVKYIQKEKKDKMQYTIVSHDAVTAKVRPALLDAGVIYYPVRCEHSQNGNRAECSMTVRFANIDEPGDYIDVPSFGYGIDAQDKGPGKAMSYAVKYALLKALGLETGDDADNESVNYDSEDPARVADDGTKEISSYSRQRLISRLSEAPDLKALAKVWDSFGKDAKADPAVMEHKDKLKLQFMNEAA